MCASLQKMMIMPLRMLSERASWLYRKVSQSGASWGSLQWLHACMVWLHVCMVWLYGCMLWLQEVG